MADEYKPPRRPLIPGPHKDRGGPPTDSRARLARATRFFARPESFTLECPHCGQIYCIRMGEKHPAWDPTTSLFRCVATQGCSKVYVLGIVAWPVSPRAWIRSVPKDQVPHPRQLAQLRKEGGGWWLAEEDKQRYPRVDESNLTPELERPANEEEDDNE